MDKSPFIYSFYRVSYFSHSSNPQLTVAFQPLLLLYFFLSPPSFRCSSPIALTCACTKTTQQQAWGSRELGCGRSTGGGLSCFPLRCAVGMAVGALPLPMQPGSGTVSFLSYFLSLKSIGFPFSALQCQLINHSASLLILDKTISLSLPDFHKDSMYCIKFVVVFPDKNVLR